MRGGISKEVEDDSRWWKACRPFYSSLSIAQRADMSPHRGFSPTSSANKSSTQEEEGEVEEEGEGEGGRGRRRSIWFKLVTKHDVVLTKPFDEGGMTR